MANKPLIDFQITGAKELHRAFQEVGETLTKKALLSFLRAAAKPVKVAAERFIISRTRVKTGKLLLSIKISTRLKSTQRSFSPRKGMAQLFVGSTAPHAHLIEFGTSPRFRKGGGFTGQVVARPFMRPAWEINKAAIKKGLIDDAMKALVKTARAARKRAERARKRGFK